MAKSNASQQVIKRYQELLLAIKEANESNPEAKVKKSDIPHLLVATILQEGFNGQASTSKAHIKAKAEDADKERKHQRFSQLMNKVGANKE